MKPNATSLEPVPYTPGSTTVWNNSWCHIYDHFANAILAYASRRGLNEHSAQDVLQEVMTTLIRCQHGQEAGYDRQGGAFQAWLWGVIKNRVRSVRRKDDKEEPASPLGHASANVQERSLPEVPQPPPDFEEREEDEWQRALLAAALRKVQTRVTPENFAIYTALLEEEATPEQLSQAYDKESNAIYVLKHRCDKSGKFGWSATPSAPGPRNCGQFPEESPAVAGIPVSRRSVPARGRDFAIVKTTVRNSRLTLARFIDGELAALNAVARERMLNGATTRRQPSPPSAPRVGAVR